MKREWSKIFSCVMLAVFVNFMFSNVVFMHLHQDASGHSMLHSHPYFPKAPHSHDSHSLDLINAFNIAAISAQSGETPVIFTPEQPIIYLPSHHSAATTIAPIRILALRGPPAK